MDKSEYNLKIEELKTAIHAHDFEKAVDEIGRAHV